MQVMAELAPKTRLRDGYDPLLAITQPHFCDPQLAIAATRAGAIGLLDLGVPHQGVLEWASLLVGP